MCVYVCIFIFGSSWIPFIASCIVVQCTSSTTAPKKNPPPLPPAEQALLPRPEEQAPHPAACASLELRKLVHNRSGIGGVARRGISSAWPCCSSRVESSVDISSMSTTPISAVAAPVDVASDDGYSFPTSVDLITYEYGRPAEEVVDWCEICGRYDRCMHEMTRMAYPTPPPFKEPPPRCPVMKAPLPTNKAPPPMCPYMKAPPKMQTPASNREAGAGQSPQCMTVASVLSAERGISWPTFRSGPNTRKHGLSTTMLMTICCGIISAITIRLPEQRCI